MKYGIVFFSFCQVEELSPDDIDLCYGSVVAVLFFPYVGGWLLSTYMTWKTLALEKSV